MTIRMQQFDHRESGYERPTQEWVCGWVLEGRACPMGPDAKGRCTAASEGECEPVKKGDRWFCTRPQVFGGACERGPRPNGECCRPEPVHPVCQPRRSLRARRGRLTWAFCGLTIGVLCVLIAGPFGRGFIDPGPLSSHHEVVKSMPPPRGTNYCAHCHTPDESSGGFLQPVTDQACLTCHDGEAHHPATSKSETILWPRDNSLGQTPMARGCTDCHSEHRGFEHRLSLVADSSCTSCHADMGAHRNPVARADMPQTLLVARVEPAVDRRATERVTSFETIHPLPRVLATPHVDTTPIRFEHRVHLSKDERMQKQLGSWVERMKADGAAASQIPALVDESGMLQLSCTACHRMEEDGHYMRPIRFQEHCVQCHDLGSKSVGEVAYAVPHGSGIVDFARRVSLESALLPPSGAVEEPAAAPERRGPGGRRGAGGPPNPADAATTAAVTETPPLERVALETKKFYQSLSTKCGQCHDPSGDPTTYVNPEIPLRWFTAAAFHHETHRFVNCQECHEMKGREVPAGLSPDELKWTGRTKELMLPAMDVCRRCHAPEAVPTPVRNDCVLCHRFHEPKPDWSTAQGLRARSLVE